MKSEARVQHQRPKQQDADRGRVAGVAHAGVGAAGDQRMAFLERNDRFLLFYCSATKVEMKRQVHDHPTSKQYDASAYTHNIALSQYTTNKTNVCIPRTKPV